MANSNNSCKERECLDKGLLPFERNNYFCGKLMVERDFWTDQLYHIWKQRMHSSYLHGWGAVCGLEVRPHPICPNLRVVIKPGFAVDCWGREIFLAQEYEVVLESYKKEGSNPVKPKKLYIHLSYNECETEPVPVFLDECGCNESCEPNRIREIFRVDLLTVDEFAPGELDKYLYDQVSSSEQVEITPTAKLKEFDGAIAIKTLSDTFKKDILADYAPTDKVQKLMDDINNSGLGIKIEYVSAEGKYVLTAVESGNVIILIESGDNPFFSGIRIPAFNTKKGNKMIEPCPDCIEPSKIILAEISDYDKVTGDFLDPNHNKYKVPAYKLDILSYRKILPKVEMLNKMMIYHTFKK